MDVKSNKPHPVNSITHGFEELGRNAVIFPHSKTAGGRISGKFHFDFSIIGFIFYKRWSKVQITVTNKRVYGYDATAKRVDLPLDSITAVGTSLFSGLAVTTASGAIKFVFLKNRDELHEEISKLLIGRQEKSSVIKQEIPQSAADELEKYKKLLDSGTITQAEFDAKKKQLLGL